MLGISRLDPGDVVRDVEWETLAFFTRLFVMVGAMVRTGVIGDLGEMAADATGGDLQGTAMALAYGSVVPSAVIDSIPFVAPVSPIVAEVVASSGARRRRCCGGPSPWARQDEVAQPHVGKALNAPDVAQRMGFDDPLLHAADLLVFPVLARDRQALVDLVRSTRSPLDQARGGAQPLLDTLTAYFDTGCVAAETARRLALSVRALTYRLERIHTLTGTNPADPAHRYTLQTAVIGARLLDWPGRPL
ncbi:SLC13 family permease [Streptomyces chartreusis]|uniref:SLC13 family permease n=1 Tax=Streptomyces chartreusis TaxID=1969 RepID=UPI003630344D